MRKIKVLIVLAVAFVTLATININIRIKAEDDISKRQSNIVTHSIDYIGGGKQPYTENGVTYYYSGNIIQLSIILPANTNSTGIAEVIRYDTSLLELQDSFNDISNSNSLSSSGWTTYAAMYDNNPNDIYVDSLANNPAIGANVSGGVVAKIKFKINKIKESESGTNVNFSFSKFSMLGFNSDAGKVIYIHSGYNEAEPSTAQINLGSISLVAEKKKNTTNGGNGNTNVDIPEGNGNTSEIILKPEVLEEIINKIPEENRQEIAATIAKKQYSFTLDEEKSLAGKDTYDSIISMINEDFNKLKHDESYKVYSFKSNKKTDVITEVNDEICYTHWILLGASALLILGSVAYVKKTHSQIKKGKE